MFLTVLTVISCLHFVNSQRFVGVWYQSTGNGTNVLFASEIFANGTAVRAIVRLGYSNLKFLNPGCVPYSVRFVPERREVINCFQSQSDEYFWIYSQTGIQENSILYRINLTHKSLTIQNF